MKTYRIVFKKRGFFGASRTVYISAESYNDAVAEAQNLCAEDETIRSVTLDYNWE